jgi:hypothetical protein
MFPCVSTPFIPRSLEYRNLKKHHRGILPFLPRWRCGLVSNQHPASGCGLSHAWRIRGGQHLFCIGITNVLEKQ